VETASDNIDQNVNNMDKLLKGFSQFNQSLIDLENNYNLIADDVLFASTKQQKATKNVFGHSNNYKPWVYSENGKSFGISIDKINKLDINAEFIGRSFSQVIDLFKRDVIDGLINMGWPNDDFGNQGYLASKPYAHFKCVVFSYSQESHPTLANKKVGVIRGGVGNSHQILRNNHAIIIEFDADKESFNALNIGDIDYVYGDESVGHFISDTFFNGKFYASEKIFEHIDVVVLTKDNRQDLIDLINSKL
jgi:ABC-type amino acid transport substrate-binding protein